MYILGIHFGHDSTAVLMRDGEVLEAMSEERLSRQKKHGGFPHLSIAYLKKKYDIERFDEVAVVGEKLRGIIFTTLEDNKRGRENPIQPKYYLRSLGVTFPMLGKLFALRDRFYNARAHRGHEEKVLEYLKAQFPDAKLTFVEHHAAHAWATLPFLADLKKKYILLTLDGAGDDLSGSVNVYQDGKIERIASTADHQSLGLLYCAITDLLGMTRNEHEFKVMGLAPYAKASSGEKVYQKLKKLLWFNDETLKFESALPLEHTTPYLIAKSYYQHRFDSLAYGIQKLTEELTKQMTLASIKKLGIKDVGIGGGVFMNVKANQYIRELSEVGSLTVTPSCGDESLAIGAAVARYSELNNGDLTHLKPLRNLYLGSAYTDEEIKAAIDRDPLSKTWKIQHFEGGNSETIEDAVAQILSENSVVGRFKGRAEWGARALGNRSILANPSSRENVKLINEMIKGRDFWMPFATSMLYERRNEYLKDADTYLAPYMAITFETKERAHRELIAALHPYDLTSRPQMVEKETNPSYHALISRFEELTGIGGILNTSFNLHGEPNVETPEDALRTFANSGLPHLAIGSYLVSKV